MNEKMYTLTMITYSMDLISGQIEKDVKEIKNCYIYKDDSNSYKIQLATKEENPIIEPYMITDNKEKIYLLKNWMKEQSNVRFCDKDKKFIVVLFNNDYLIDTNWDNFKLGFARNFNIIINNLNKFKEDIIDKLED